MRRKGWAAGVPAALAFASLACGSSDSPSIPANAYDGGTARPVDGGGTRPPAEGGAPEGGNAPEGGQTALWYKFLGDGANEDVGGVAVDASGNVYFTGYFQGTIDFGGGPLTADGMSSDVYLAKYDKSGDYVWAHRYGDTQVQVASGVALDAQGNVYITGVNMGVLDFGDGSPLVTAGQEDIFVAKLDPTGKTLWAKDFGDPTHQLGNSVAVDLHGNVALTGSVEGTTNFGMGTLTSAGMADIFVAELDTNGNALYSALFGDALNQYGWFVQFDPSGNMVLTADYQGTVTFGTQSLTSAGEYDVLLAKLSPSGQAAFAHGWGDPLNQVGDGVAVDPAGDIVLSGGFQGSINLGSGALTAQDEGAKFLAKFDASGDLLWAKSFGDGDVFDWTSVGVDTTGAPVIVGEFVDTIDFGLGPIQAKDMYDIFVARFDASGNPVWADRYGAADDQYARSVALAENGDVVFGGYFLGKLGFDNGGGMMATGNGLLYLVDLEP